MTERRDYVLFTVRLADGSDLTRRVYDGQSFVDAFGEDILAKLHPEAISRGVIMGRVPMALGGVRTDDRAPEAAS